MTKSRSPSRAIFGPTMTTPAPLRASAGAAVALSASPSLAARAAESCATETAIKSFVSFHALED